MIVRTEAVVLRSLDYGETSRIVTLFTRSRGRVSIMARGARSRKSRFGSTLQPMSYIQAVYYYKASRELQTLSESSHIRAFNDIGRRLEKMAVGLRVVELAASLLEEEQSSSVFDLLVNVLSTLNDVETNVQNLLPLFQLKLAVALGIEPGFARDEVAALTDEGGVLSLASGEIHRAGTMVPNARRASREALRAFAICTRARVEPVLALEMTATVRKELDELIGAYYRYHVGHAYAARSGRVLNQLLPGEEPSST